LPGCAKRTAVGDHAHPGFVALFGGVDWHTMRNRSAVGSVRPAASTSEKEEDIAMIRLLTHGIACTLIIGAVWAACNASDGDPTPDAGEREALVCDAIYLPILTFTFTDEATGEPYCGPAEVSYEVLGDFDVHDWYGSSGMSCECRDGVMMVTEGTYFDSFECHLVPPRGETSVVRVTAPGYQTFEQEVTLPYVCEPFTIVEARLAPTTP
jgi:hypothetical protein